MRVAAVDIGTNTVRLLVADVVDGDSTELTRLVEVVGLGVGVDRSGHIAADAIERAAAALARFAEVIESLAPVRKRAIATSAMRDAENRSIVLDRLEEALGFRPEVIGGDEEAALSFRGASLGRTGTCLVIDPGGGSTEFVFGAGEADYDVSIDIGSVRLTDRLLSSRPASSREVAAARRHAAGLFEAVQLSDRADTVIGVAGTFTALAGLHGVGTVDGTILGRDDIDGLVDRLASLTIEETMRLRSLDPKRAPVILGGAIVASEALWAVGATQVIVSERDSLDGISLGLGA